MEETTRIQAQFIRSSLVLGLSIIPLGVCSANPLVLPVVDPQSDRWSCGPNSATRLLRFYGHEVTYSQLKQLTGKKLLLVTKFRGQEIGTGTPPRVLQTVIGIWEQDKAKLKQNAQLRDLLQVLAQGKPAIALVRVGNISLGKLTIPALHWITVTGFDPQEGKIYYTDTNNQNYQISYAEFDRRWQLSLNPSPVTAILKLNGVMPRTFVWIDRRPT